MQGVVFMIVSVFFILGTKSWVPDRHKRLSYDIALQNKNNNWVVSLSEPKNCLTEQAQGIDNSQ